MLIVIELYSLSIIKTSVTVCFSCVYYIWLGSTETSFLWYRLHSIVYASMLVLFVVYLVQAVFVLMVYMFLSVLYSGTCTSLVSSPDYPAYWFKGMCFCLLLCFCSVLTTGNWCVQSDCFMNIISIKMHTAWFIWQKDQTTLIEPVAGKWGQDTSYIHQSSPPSARHTIISVDSHTYTI